MDIALYLRVLWRFRLLVLLGVVCAASLAILSIVRIGADGVSYRQSELWSSNTRLLVTQRGFPEGRLYGQQPTENPSSAPVVDPGRFNNLAILYANLATSDQVRRLIAPGGRLQGELIAIPVVGGGEFKAPLPLIDLTAVATSPRGATALAQRSAAALSEYIQNQQRAGNVPVADRAVIEQIERPSRAVVFKPRSKTMPVIVFLAVMLVTIGLAFLLENLRPPPPAEAGNSSRATIQEPQQRRSA